MTKQFVLSPIETEVVRVIGRDALREHHWFPIVRREVMNSLTGASDEQFHAAIVGLVRKGALVDVETNCWKPPKWTALPEAFESAPALQPYEKPAHFRGMNTASEFGPEAPQRFELSLLESQIVLTINNVGWFAYLWFPVIQRELMNFGLREPEEKVHSTLVGLIRRGALVVTEESDEFPQWNPTGAALEATARCEFPSQIP